jgi:hypothetical protein
VFFERGTPDRVIAGGVSSGQEKCRHVKFLEIVSQVA